MHRDGQTIGSALAIGYSLTIGTKRLAGSSSQAEAPWRTWVCAAIIGCVPMSASSLSVQYERWLFPVIQPNSARNVTTGVEVQFHPQKLFQRSAANNTFGTGGRP